MPRSAPPTRITPTHLALALMVAGVLVGFYPPALGFAGLLILIGLITALGRFAYWLVKLWT